MPRPAARTALALGLLPWGAATVHAATGGRVEVATAALIGLGLLGVVVALALGLVLGMLCTTRRHAVPLAAPARDPDAVQVAHSVPPPAATAAGLDPEVLDLINQPLLVLTGLDEQASVERFNAAACQLAPGLRAGQPVRPLLEALAPAMLLASTTAGLDHGSAGPWRWARVGGGAAPRLWLLKTGELEAEQFSFSLGHDLRAPVRVVEGFTRIVKEDYGAALDRVANDHLDRVLGAAARMNAMIDAILKLAQLAAQPLQRQPVHLSQLAGWVLDDLRRQQPERMVTLEIAPDLVAQGDPTLLRLLLENLLGNAWKYSARTPQARIAFGRTQHHGREVFVVQDNGAGFDMRSTERLFGLFQRLHSAGEFPGHGVGLASVRRIVQRHGGQIWAESEPGQGARFYFTLEA